MTTILELLQLFIVKMIKR